MARPQRHFRGRSSPGRLTQWVGPADQAFLAIASTATSILSSILFEEPVTVVRTRGWIGIQPGAFTADVNIVGAVGVGIVTAEAFNAGVASVPSPYLDADWGGWLVWRSFGYRFEKQTTDTDLLVDWGFEVDSKAMRKVQANERLVVVAESQVGAFNIMDGLRTLIKLS